MSRVDWRGQTTLVTGMIAVGVTALVDVSRAFVDRLRAAGERTGRRAAA